VSSNFIIGGATSASARLHVRGDGTNPFARFEDLSGASWVQIGLTSGLPTISFSNSTYFQSDSTVTNFYAASQRVDYLTYQASGSYALSSQVQNNINATSGTRGVHSYGSTFAAPAGSANYRSINLAYTINNTGAQTGTATGIFLNATETNLNGMAHNLMDLQASGTSRFRVTGNCAIATFDLNGLNIANSVRATDFQIGASSSRLLNTSDGVIRMANNASNDFNRLQFGGTTNAFPAIKRNAAAIDFRLADDSAFCSISINSLDAAANLQLGATGNIRFAGITKIQSPSAGIITLGNDSVTDFSRLQFGGTTSSFPAIARSSANMIISLADAAAGSSLGVGMSVATGVNASAVLQADSTTKGFLPPRMTTAQRDLISSPAAGLMIYNTSTNVLNFFNGSVWGAV
jgi:hypothetical protein